MSIATNVNSLVKRSGIHLLIKSEAIKYVAMFDQMDSAEESDNWDLWETISSRQSALKVVITAKVVKALPMKMEDVVVRNLVASAIDLAVK